MASAVAGTESVTESTAKQTEVRKEHKRVNEQTVTIVKTKRATKEAVNVTCIECDCGRTCIVFPTKAPVMKLQCFGVDSFQKVSDLAA